MSLRDVFDGLGDETWRLYVDLDSQSHGPHAYDRGLGKGREEPGYLASMAAAHRLVGGSLGRRLTVGFLDELHRATLAHAPPQHTYRPGGSYVGLHRDRLEPGIEKVWAAHDANAEEQDERRVRLVFAARTRQEFVARIEAAIDELYLALERAESSALRVRAIAAFHQSLELWHPTSDGNTRRHGLVLSKLLVESGETPAIMTEINDAYVRLASSWARMITQGMQRWRVVRDAIANGEDVEERMHAFDREGSIGRRGARWLRPNQTSYAFDDWEHVSFVDD